MVEKDRQIARMNALNNAVQLAARQEFGINTPDDLFTLASRLEKFIMGDA